MLREIYKTTVYLYIRLHSHWPWLSYNYEYDKFALFIFWSTHKPRKLNANPIDIDSILSWHDYNKYGRLVSLLHLCQTPKFRLQFCCVFFSNDFLQCCSTECYDFDHMHAWFLVDIFFVGFNFNFWCRFSVISVRFKQLYTVCISHPKHAHNVNLYIFWTTNIKKIKWRPNGRLKLTRGCHIFSFFEW